MRFTTIATTVVAALVLSIGLAGPANAASAIQFRKFYYDTPGTDTSSNLKLNGEWFALKNVSTSRVNLSGWTVRDVTGYTYRFSSTFYLRPGYTVRIHTGKGTNTATNRYWGRTWYVWNNSGDKATLKNSAGTIKDTCAWTSIGVGYKTC